MEFVGEQAAVVDCLAAMACACGITTLNNETRDETVKYGVVVVTVEAELEKVAGRERGV